MLRPTKRQRLECPPSWMDCESLARVPSHDGSCVDTAVADSHTQEIFLERFRKEIVERLHYTLTIDTKPADDSDAAKSKLVVSKRILVGVNACSKLLQEPSESAPETSIGIIVCCDVPSLLSHVPVCAKQRDIPILLLPQSCCRMLGEMIGIRRASIILFLQSKQATERTEEADAIHGAIDSFVDFVCNKLVASR